MNRSFEDWLSDNFDECDCDEIHVCDICNEEETYTYKYPEKDCDSYFICESCQDAEWESVCD